ncbi:MAG: hydrolase, partial [Flavobacteriaceae bacterium]|nr:hydrolase [Flavobacteriaceae bacterium]
MNKANFTPLLFLFFIPLILFGQNAPNAEARYTNKPPVIDGNLNDEAWINAQTISHFRQNFPTDTLPAQYPTYIKFLFDDTYLYIAIQAKSSGTDFVATSLKR